MTPEQQATIEKILRTHADETQASLQKVIDAVHRAFPGDNRLQVGTVKNAFHNISRMVATCLPKTSAFDLSAITIKGVEAERGASAIAEEAQAEMERLLAGLEISGLSLPDTNTIGSRDEN